MATKDEIKSYFTANPNHATIFSRMSQGEKETFMSKVFGNSAEEEPEIKDAFNIPAQEVERRVSPVVAGAAGLTAGGVESIPQTVAELGVGGLRAANTASMGLLRYAARKAGTDIPTPESSIGKTIGVAGDVAGFMAPGTLLSKGLTKVGVPAAKTMLGGATRGALEGGILGATFTPEDDFTNVNQRALAGLGGATIGSIFGTVSQIPGAYNRIKSKFVDAKASSMISEKIKEAEKAFRVKASRADKAVNVLKDRIKNSSEITKKALEGQLDLSANQEASVARQQLKRGLGEVSKKYGDAINQIEDAIINARAGKELTKQEIFNILQEAHAKNIANNVQGTPSASKIMSLMEKYKPEQVVPSKLIVDASGRPIGTPQSSPSQPVDFKEFVSDIRNVGALKGGKKASVNDLAKINLRETWGNFLSEFDNGDFSNLQKQYATTMNELRPLIQKAKPYGASYENEPIAKVINDVVNGRANKQTVSMLQQLEDGVGMFEGVGNVKPKSAADALKIEQLVRKTETALKQVESLGKQKSLKFNKQASDYLKGLGVDKNAMIKMEKEAAFREVMNAAAGTGAIAGVFYYALKRYFGGKMLGALQTVTGQESSAGE